MPKLTIFALHPISYQTPIFRELNILRDHYNNFKLEVVFLDDSSTKPVYYEHLQSEVTFDDNLCLDNYEHIFLKNYSKKKKGFFSRINPGIISYLIFKRPKFVLIHGYETFSSWIILLLCKLLFIKISFRGESVIEGEIFNEGIIQKLKRVILPIFFSLFSVVFYSCTGNKKFFQKYNVSNSKMRFLPCAVDNELILRRLDNAQLTTSETSNQLGIDLKNDFVIIFCARFTERKRPLDLIKAASKINSENLKLLFVGDGPCLEDMKSLSQKLGVNSIFTGFVQQKDLAKFFSLSNLFVVISSKDPSPKTLNEAMVAGLPVIVSDVVGTSADLVSGNGFVVPVGDIELIASRIKNLMNDRLLAKKMGGLSKEIVSHWTIKNDAISILNAFNEYK